MIDPHPGHEKNLVAFATRVHAEDVEFDTETGVVSFLIGPFEVDAYVKTGASRIRGSVQLGDVDDTDEGVAWISRQTPPQSGVLEVVKRGHGEPGHLLRLLFERSLAGPMAEEDWLFTDAINYGEAWHLRDDLTHPSDAAGAADAGDPRDLVPENAWLLMGTDQSFPSREQLEIADRESRVGVFDTDWTAAKQTVEGDLALIYFMTPRKAVHFITRAASAAFFDRTLEVASDIEVANEQWWAYFTPLIEIEPIPVDVLRERAGGHLVLQGRSGHFLPPETIASLPVRAKYPADQAALDRVLVTPVGRADLPDPIDVTIDMWPQIASGALLREKDVSRYIVEPLLRFALHGTALAPVAEHPIGKKSVDYAVLDGDRPRCVIEVKLAIRASTDGVWAKSKDFIQMRGYAESLGCPAILIDANRVLLVATGEDAPYRVIERRHVSSEDLNAIKSHLTLAAATE